MIHFAKTFTHKHKKSLIFAICAFSFFSSSQLFGATQLTDKEVEDMTQKVTPIRGSIHDPSIVSTTNNSGITTYYVFGSHMGVSKTTDLLNWTNVFYESTTNAMWGTENASGVVTKASYSIAFKTNKTTKVKALVNGNIVDVDFGNFDANAYHSCLKNTDGTSVTTSGHMWAPDIIYNPILGKWCIYQSLAGSDYMNSVIIMCSSENIEGPFVYQGPVVFGGFNVTTNSTTDWTKTDLGIALGTTSLPARYNVGSRSNFHKYWPSCIDPCVFYDDNGDLWMAYGSWSGGIFMLKLDKNTGLRDYTYTYETDYDSRGRSLTTDAYYGKKIAGGWYVSGEGPYIQKIGSYYYLFMSYGGFAPDGGYEMRIFRSSSPTGPYTDMNSISAIYTSYQMNYGTNAATNRGMKLMGGYLLDNMDVAEIAQGHNSAIVDSEGKAYVMYHTKFNDGTAGHAMRVHQLFTNERGWITAAPYEYSNEKITDADIASKELFSANEIIGDYQLITHKYKVDYANFEYSKPENITLNADGTVSGTKIGSWAISSGTSYITIKLGTTEYKGVIIPQTIDGSNYGAIGITAMCVSNGVNIWATKPNDASVVAMNYNAFKSSVSEGMNVYSDLDIDTDPLYGATVTWTSSNENIISNTGKVTFPESDTKVSLSVKIEKNEVSYQKTYELNVVGGVTTDYKSGIVAYYDMNSNLINRYNTSSVGEAAAMSSGTKPSYYNDATRNVVLHQYFGYPDASSTSYTKFDNPLKGQTLKGATLSMWLKREDTNVWDAIWCFYLGTLTSDGGRLYMTGNTYLGYNNNAGSWFDCNHPSNITTNYLTPSVWNYLTITFNDSGFNIYINGKTVSTQSNYGSFSSGSFSNYQAVLNLISSSLNFYLGYGSFWGSAPAFFDDLLIYNRELNAGDVKALYAAAVDGESFKPTSASLFEKQNKTIVSTKYYDIKGARLDAPLQNGCTIVVKLYNDGTVDSEKVIISK